MNRRPYSDGYFPADFLAVLWEARPALRSEEPAIQAGFAYLAWVAPMKRRRHRKWEGYAFVSHKEVERRFGRGNLIRANKRVSLFEIIEQWSVGDGHSRGYRLAPDVHAAVDCYNSRVDDALIPLLWADGRRLRTAPRAIASKNADGITARAWRNAKVQNLTPVDRDRLFALRAHYRRMQSLGAVDRENATILEIDGTDALANHLDILGRVIKLSRTDVAGDGYIMHRYVESEAGRLFAIGVNLQNAPGAIKKAALHGLWEYDLENCHFEIVRQMAARGGHHVRTIASYCENKAAVRRDLAARVGISIPDAKACLLAILYGATATEWWEAAIPQQITSEKARILYRDPLFDGFLHDVKHARKEILARWPKSRGARINDAGCSAQASNDYKRDFSHLTQGAEAAMLRAVLAHHREDLVLLQHDGFVSRRRLDTRALERIVATATGYEMKMEEKQIQLPAGVYDSEMTNAQLFLPQCPGFSGEGRHSVVCGRALEVIGGGCRWGVAGGGVGLAPGWLVVPMRGCPPASARAGGVPGRAPRGVT
jgi:hypothetical protein